MYKFRGGDVTSDIVLVHGYKTRSPNTSRDISLRDRTILIDFVVTSHLYARYNVCAPREL